MRLPFAAPVEIVAIVAIASLACSSDPPEVPVVEEIVVQLHLGTDRTGTSGAALGERIAAILNAQTDQSWSVSAVSTGGSAENIRKVTSGELAFALSRSAVSNAAQQPHPLRTIITLESEVVALMASPGSSIREVADLAGENIVIGPAGSGLDQIVEAVLEAHGMPGNGFAPLNATATAAIEMLGDGSADAAFIALPSTDLPGDAVESGYVLVPFDETALAAVIADRPELARATIAANTFDGQAADAPALGIGPIHVITSVDQDADLVYRITRFLYERRDQLTLRAVTGGLSRGLTVVPQLDAVRSTGIEFHPGAVRFYREIGVWQE